MPTFVPSTPSVTALLTSPLVLSAVWVTIWTAIAAQALGIALGIPLGIAQLSRSRLLRGCAWAYNWFFQGTPLLMQLVFFWAVLPMLGLTLELMVAGLVGLGLNEAARMSQIVRAAMIGVDDRQYEAARTLGMSRWQILRLITAPQALRIALPPTGNELNYQFKATSLLAAISIVELTRQTLNFADRNPANPVPYFVVAAIYYLAMSTVWGWFQGWLERSSARRGFA
jgi:polar amino acid transport system permease protein